jgi:putative MATE family efflux protein
VFNQSLLRAAFTGAATLAAGYAVSDVYVAAITADAATRAAGTTYLHWFLPGLSLQFALMTIGSALRGIGVVKPTMVTQSFTVLLNTVLAPVLIIGWGTGRPLGVAGAGLASTIAVAAGVVVLTAYFAKREKYVEFRRALWWPQFATWKRLLAIGLPASAESTLMFAYFAVIYLAINDFGAAAQAGFGIGSRIVQSIYLPAIAIALAAGTIAGQNFGAGQAARVRQTFAKAMLLNSAVMLLVTLLLQWRPDVLVAFFTAETEVQAVGTGFLHVMSFMFLAQGVVYTCFGLFQGLGNMRPPLASFAIRLAVFVPAAFWLAARSDFRVEHVWYLSVATSWFQAAMSYSLLRAQFRRRLAVQPVLSYARVAVGGQG